jgi:hypothetical protein
MRLRRLSLPLVALATLALAWPADDRGAGPALRARSAASPAPLQDRLVLALLEPERIASVDLRSGKVATLRLMGGTLCRSPLLVVDGRIVFVAPGRRGGRVMSVDLALRERPHWLATADVVVRSPVPGHVWAATRAPGRHGHWLVQDLTVRGASIARPPRRAPSRPIVGAVSEGLVLQGRSGTFVWDPRTGRRLRPTPGPWVLATAGSLVASCGGHCGTLLLADGERGRVVHAPPGRRFLPTGAAFSPDGATLAVPLTPFGRPRLALVDTATGARRLLDGTALGQRAAIAFSPEGDRLYAVDNRSGRVRAFALDGRPLGVAGPSLRAPVVQLLVGSP